MNTDGMKTDELMECLREMQKKYHMQFEVLPINHLTDVSIQHYPLAMIVNTDPAPKPGQHWAVLYRKTQYAELEGFCR